MVNDKPTVYNTSSVYKEAGGGGGGLPIPDTDYKRLKFISISKMDAPFPNCGLSLSCAFDDTIEFSCFIHSNVGEQWKYLFHNGNLSFSLKLEGANSRIYGKWNEGGFVETDTHFVKGQITCVTNKDIITFNGTNYTQNKGNSTNFTISNAFHFNENVDLDVYEFNVFDNLGVIKYNCVPAIRLQDSVLGLYDLITERFFGSNFTTPGPEI